MYSLIDSLTNIVSSIRRAAKPNLTGFDPKAFARAAGPAGGPKNDPWARAYVYIWC